MEINTHDMIDKKLCGSPELLENGYCRTVLKTVDIMKADRNGLIHGGFIFGAADFAAMLAVNHPNVVLCSSKASFFCPVKVGDVVCFEAKIIENKGKKNIVNVKAFVKDNEVFEGEFVCISPHKHVLSD